MHRRGRRSRLVVAAGLAAGYYLGSTDTRDRYEDVRRLGRLWREMQEKRHHAKHDGERLGNQGDAERDRSRDEIAGDDADARGGEPDADELEADEDPLDAEGRGGEPDSGDLDAYDEQRDGDTGDGELDTGSLLETDEERDSDARDGALDINGTHDHGETQEGKDRRGSSRRTSRATPTTRPLVHSRGNPGAPLPEPPSQPRRPLSQR